MFDSLKNRMCYNIDMSSDDYSSKDGVREAEDIIRKARDSQPKPGQMDLEAGPIRREVLGSLRQQGFSEDEAKERLNYGVTIAKRLLTTPRVARFNERPSARNLLPTMIVACLGEEYDREERRLIVANFPGTGALVPDEYHDPRIKELMGRFSLSMRNALAEVARRVLENKGEFLR